MDPNFLAPEMTQRLALVSIEASNIVGGALLCLKTLAFRLFQKVHETSMARDALACRFGVAVSQVLAHQASTESNRGQPLVSRPRMWNLSMIKDQSLHA